MHDTDDLHHANIIYEALHIAEPNQEWNTTHQTKSHHSECQLGRLAEDRAKSVSCASRNADLFDASVIGLIACIIIELLRCKHIQYIHSKDKNFKLSHAMTNDKQRREWMGVQLNANIGNGGGLRIPDICHNACVLAIFNKIETRISWRRDMRLGIIFVRKQKKDIKRSKEEQKSRRQKGIMSNYILSRDT